MGERGELDNGEARSLCSIEPFGGGERLWKKVKENLPKGGLEKGPPFPSAQVGKTGVGRNATIFF